MADQNVNPYLSGADIFQAARRTIGGIAGASSIFILKYTIKRCVRRFYGIGLKEVDRTG